jgi:hypothetical protein
MLVPNKTAMMRMMTTTMTTKTKMRTKKMEATLVDIRIH